MARQSEGSRVRRGVIALITAFLLVVLIGMIACALDIGWAVMARTQLQAAADSASLAGGTELLPGLGLFATSTPEEVNAAARARAVEYAARNPNADLASTFVHAGRDVKLGKAVFDSDCGCWSKSEGEEPYNYVEVTTHRDQAGSGGDRPVPLFFARIFNRDQINLMATATAVIMPADGFRVAPGSGDRANVMPFAFKEEYWDRFLRAQDYYDANPEVFDDPGTLGSIPDPANPDGPLFGAYDQNDNFVQLFFDNYTRMEDGVVASGADTNLEIDVYPRNLKFDSNDELDSGPCSGNFGTINFGNNNSTNDLRRLIREGLNEDDLANYENNEIVLSEEDPLDENADPGISAGMKDALEDVKGECKAIVLFTTATGPGGNCVFTLVKFVAASVVHVNFTGNNKQLLMQPCTLVDSTAVADLEGEIGENTTIFTPLILIE